ncbi:eukaryotic translation initiation factor 4e related [Anaeramoeba flamelloides]|uniref:Eukaryotic translation initiation factor 4e related n=1 Tax=Anaeramoeba flamelloides TaxID=1746091 RepID=A0ABQ8XMK9_9EUKA|nr:eukaryotic translation initiation factor 4e related [Anaeramoeba flamelloides]
MTSKKETEKEKEKEKEKETKITQKENEKETETETEKLKEKDIKKGHYTLDFDPEQKHPLQNKWTMWVDGYSGSRNWGEDMKKILDFETVEDFWGMFNNLVSVSKLKNGTNFHLFKYGIKPEWEDSGNISGGKWNLRINRSVSKLEDLWLDTVLSLIGERFEPKEEICGAVVSIRNSGDRIALWTKTASKKDVQLEIGKIWKKDLQLRGIRLSYLTHKKALSTNKRGGLEATYEL